MSADNVAPVIRLGDRRGDEAPVEPELVQDDRAGLAYKVLMHGRYVGAVWSDDGGASWTWVYRGQPSGGIPYWTPGAAADALLTMAGARP